MTESPAERFDGVRVMREIRDRISAEIADMSHDELVAWLRGHVYVDPLLRRLAEEIARSGKASDRPSSSG